MKKKKWFLIEPSKPINKYKTESLNLHSFCIIFVFLIVDNLSNSPNLKKLTDGHFKLESFPGRLYEPTACAISPLYGIRWGNWPALSDKSCWDMGSCPWDVIPPARYPDNHHHTVISAEMTKILHDRNTECSDFIQYVRV